jgi:hypothetical protein
MVIYLFHNGFTPPNWMLWICKDNRIQDENLGNHAKTLVLT